MNSAVEKALTNRPAITRFQVFAVSVLSLLLIWLLDVFLLNQSAEDAKQDTPDKIEKEVEVESTEMSPDDLRLAMDMPTAQLQNISLPAPPKLANSSSSLSTQADTPQVSQRSEAQARSSKIINETSSELREQGLKAQVMPSSMQNINEHQIKSTYQRLSELSPSRLRFFLPQQKVKRERFLHYMYVCQGMQFGAISTHKHEQSLMLLHESSDISTSNLLRVAQGQLSQKERRLINAYSPNGIPVRLFPENIDLALSQYLSSYLNGNDVHEFSAHYQLINNVVSLINIQINGRQVSQTWPLSNSVCR